VVGFWGKRGAKGGAKGGGAKGGKGQRGRGKGGAKGWQRGQPERSHFWEPARGGSLPTSRLGGSNGPNRGQTDAQNPHSLKVWAKRPGSPLLASPAELLATIAPGPPIYASAESRKTDGSDCLEFAITALRPRSRPVFSSSCRPYDAHLRQQAGPGRRTAAIRVCTRGRRRNACARNWR
jgi:hypothetical protein